MTFLSLSHPAARGERKLRRFVQLSALSETLAIYRVFCFLFFEARYDVISVIICEELTILSFSPSLTLALFLSSLSRGAHFKTEFTSASRLLHASFYILYHDKPSDPACSVWALHPPPSSTFSMYAPVEYTYIYVYTHIVIFLSLFLFLFRSLFLPFPISLSATAATA